MAIYKHGKEYFDSKDGIDTESFAIVNDRKPSSDWEPVEITDNWDKVAKLVNDNTFGLIIYVPASDKMGS